MVVAVVVQSRGNANCTEFYWGIGALCRLSVAHSLVYTRLLLIQHLSCM